jgi:hypothetical protein
VNGIDADGRWFGIDDAIAAGVGFAVGYGIHGVTTGDWLSASAVKAGAKGALVGWVGYNTAGVGLEFAVSATGATGLATGSGMAAATFGGMAGGAIMGAEAGAISYGFDVLTGDANFSLTGLYKQTAYGALGGAALGGLAGGIGYSLSDAAKWETHKTVAQAGLNRLDAGDNQLLDYANSNVARFSEHTVAIDGSIDALPDPFGRRQAAFGGTDDLGNITLTRRAMASPEDFYTTLAHESQHQIHIYTRDPVRLASINAQEALVRAQIKSNSYYQYWGSAAARNNADLKYLVNLDQGQTGMDIRLQLRNHGFLGY